MTRGEWLMPPFPEFTDLGLSLATGVCRCADYVLLNKTDMLKEGQLASLSDIAKSLNPLAKACAPQPPAPQSNQLSHFHTLPTLANLAALRPRL